ncbi:MAG TPA: hypothetical protein VKA19_00375, partial [Alphaproteobacteria bacterium]|nr:hypothetical protein [Alphaproteobacteria bacterium]
VGYSGKKSSTNGNRAKFERKLPRRSFIMSASPDELCHLDQIALRQKGSTLSKKLTITDPNRMSPGTFFPNPDSLSRPIRTDEEAGPRAIYRRLQAND